MGIPQLFDIIHEYEESVLIAQLAEEHFQRHNRPLRIAVDEADWRFNNVTQAQVYAIRDASDQAYQGQEKAMFWRICRFLTLGIQLIFVFDGPSRPWKRGGRGGGKIDWRARDLLKEVLRHLGIPYHEAPGEAEAECARLQMLGLVDAVWSQDSDCLMFGCTTWIRDDRVAKEKGIQDRSKENTQKSKKTARIVRAHDLKQGLQIDREGLVLFAMLVGGDYDAKGLPGCGPKIAMKAVQRGLGKGLCACRNQRDCDAWSRELDDCLRTSGGRGIAVPFGFPDFKTLVKYNTPKVTPDQALLNNSRLNLSIVRPINELELLETTSSRFNIWGKFYMNWIGPILLCRALSSRDPALPREVVHDITLVKERAKQADVGVPQRVFERKIKFSPFGVSSLTKEDFAGERLGYWTGTSAVPFDPTYRVEKCEMADFLLRKVLPADVLHPPSPKPKSKPTKRKEQVETSETAKSPAVSKRQRIAHAAPDTTPAKRSQSRSAPNPTSSSQKKSSANWIGDLIELSDSDDELRLPPGPLPSASSARPAPPRFIDLGSPSSEEDSTRTVPYLAAVRPLVQQTPSRMNQDQVEDLRPDLATTEDDDLRLALQLSMQEDVTPSRKRSRIATDLTSRAKRDEKRPGPSTQYASEHRRLAARATYEDLRNASSGLPQNSFFPEDTSTAPLAEVTVSTISSTAVEDIRAARLRHFQNPPIAESSTVGTPKAILQSHGTPTRTDGSKFRVPPGVSCIDLTDD